MLLFARSRLRLFVLLAVVLTPACSDSEETTYPWDTLPTATPASYKAGTPVIVSEAKLDATGGTLEGKAGTPVAGVKVIVPAGALAEATTLSLGHDQGGTFSNVPTEEQNVVLVLKSSGASAFAKPLRVEVPFNDPTRIPVFYYLNESGGFEVMPPLRLDRAAGKAGFQTWHASNYTFVNADPSSPQPVYNRFDPALDGFSIDNTVKVKYAPGGRCWGISSFSKWYKQKAGGGLAQQFLDAIPTTTEGEESQPRAGQELIATRMHNSVAYYAAENQPEPQDMASFIASVRDALSKGAPAVMVGLTSPAGAHAVLAIAYSDNQVAFYDSNHPGKFKAADYTIEPANLGYGTYTDFAIFGNGELRLNEPHQQVLDDANAGFHGENETKIEVTSHKDGDTVSSNEISLEGKIHSGQVLISEIEARVIYEDLTQSEPRTLPMPPTDNSFKLPLTLKKGDNYITFITKGHVAYQGTQVIPNDVKAFLLKVGNEPQPTSSLRITSSRTETSSTGRRKEETSTLTANVVYQVQRPQMLTSSFDWSSCTAMDQSMCDFLAFATFDSFGLSSKQLPVTVEWHLKIYEKNSKGEEVLTYYQDSAGSLSCNSIVGDIIAEPGGTAASHTWRFVAKPTDVCLTAETTPMVTGKYKFTTDSTDWNELEPEPMSLYRAAPYAMQMDRSPLEPCEHPPRIPSAALEAWAAEEKSPQTFSMSASLDNCTTSSDTTRKETTTVTLTLVP